MTAIHLIRSLFALREASFIVNSYKNILPAVVVAEDGELVAEKVEIKGNKTQDTVGVLIQKGNATITESKIHSHLQGGIHVWAHKKNQVNIMYNKIVFNNKCGVHVVGQDSSIKIEANKIENNNGSGVVIGIGNKSKVLRNEIMLNTIGVEVIAGDPLIFCNKIDKNYQDGIFTTSHKNLRSAHTLAHPLRRRPALQPQAAKPKAAPQLAPAVEPLARACPQSQGCRPLKD